MEYVEAEGRSIDAAIDTALSQLGVSREKVDVEILANATKGLFGLGGKKARVRATLRAPISITEEESHPPDRPNRPAPAKDGKGKAPQAAASAKAPGRARTKRPRDEQKKESRPPRQRREESDNRPARPIDEATLENARAVLEQTIRLIGTDASVQISRDDLGIGLLIEGDESGILIGRRGQTLDALEYMINRVASRDTGHTTRIVVDSHSYRQRRRESLEALAKRMGERAIERGKPVTMNPMSPRDRRIVHLALQDETGLETRSAGKGYFRKLLVVPKR